ncbi:hypothetical protein [Solimonas marina]|uniref:Uncharacterized protein n=1 Tax=Solimonas marina TaxID=2714601 RepID=A0A969WCR4_9GAMM|nr:hypothetical protein [Solimonas marina]NKF24134.1 hypothetical protein [Solimonas marina]
MMSIVLLWLPVLLSAVGVFVASSFVHMVFRWHNADYRPLPNEDEVSALLRRAGAAPGQYVLPYCADMKQLQSAPMQERFAAGPNGLLILRGNGPVNMGRQLGLWLLLTLLVSLIVAAVASAALPLGAIRHQVFHVCALIALAAYACGSISDGIWKGHPWRAVVKDLVDALIYAVVTGACFAWLWPGS